jgi:hypothetical protein
MGNKWNLVFILLALALPIAAVIALIEFTSQKGLPATAQPAWEAYVKYQRSLSPTAKITIQKMVRASRPWNFTPPMSKAAYRRQIYHPTVDTLSATPIEISPYQLKTAEPWISYIDDGIGLGEAYPPEQVWCVWLKEAPQQTSGLVFVVLHQDLYTAYWLVHEPAGEIASPDFKIMLSSLGCEFQHSS